MEKLAWMQRSMALFILSTDISDLAAESRQHLTRHFRFGRRISDHPAFANV
jgi:hypothetical protein